MAGSSGQKLIDEKKSMSTPCLAEPSAQPSPALNVKPIEAESEKENQIRAPPLPVETPVVPISAPVAEPPVSNTSGIITIRPKVRPEENSTGVGREHKKTSSSSSSSKVATLKETRQILSRSRSPQNLHQMFPTIYATPSPATTPRDASATIASSG